MLSGLAELAEYRHGHRAISDDAEESHGPLGAVASADSHAVARPDTSMLEEQMEFGYLAGHILVLERDTVEVGQRKLFPVVAHRLQYIGIERILMLHI